MFTRQHYKAIAAMARAVQTESPDAQLQLFIARLAQYFLRDNPGFDIAKFYEACSIQGVKVYRIKP